MTVLPTVRRQLLRAAQAEANRRKTRLPRPLRRPKAGYVLMAALIAVPVLVAGGALVLLSHRQISPRTPIASGTASTRHSVPHPVNLSVRVQVVHGDRYCTSPRGETPERCPMGSRGLIRLGGVSQQWLVIFSFIAPRPATVGGRTYYYFTADAPVRCPNASQFGENNADVRTGQRVVLWAAFDKNCPGAGHGTISLITRRNGARAPGEGASQSLASFTFTIPRTSSSPAIDPAVAAQLSVFRRARTSADELPAAFRAELPSVFGGARPDAADARRVTASDGQNAYLMPTSDGVCVINANEAFCSSAMMLPGASVADLCSPALPKGQLEIEWLLPDSSRNVTVGLANGTARSFAPGLNVYIARFPISGPVPKTIAWDVGGHHYTGNTSIPSDIQSQKCAHPSSPSGAPAKPTITSATMTTETGPGVATVVKPPIASPPVLIGPRPRVNRLKSKRR
jgi:hypothetical protein